MRCKKRKGKKMKNIREICIQYGTRLAAAGVCMAVLLLSACAAQKKEKETRERERPEDERQLSDYQRMVEENYDTLFVSMYANDNFRTADFQYYREYETLKAGYTIPDASTIEQYIEKALEAGKKLERVYIGADPTALTGEALLEIAGKFPELSFEVLVSYPSASYWKGLTEEKASESLEAYQSFLEDTISEERISVYFFSGARWLVCNSLNYEEDLLTNVSVSRRIFLNADIDHRYYVTGKNLERMWEEFLSLVTEIRKAEETGKDFADTDIVFVGDSIFGNYTDSTSIPEATRSLTGARVYNCGYGGNSASLNDGREISFPGIARQLGEKSIEELPVGTQLYEGAKRFEEEYNPQRKRQFVINYGLNDYFSGYPARGDAEDITCYYGAMNVGIRHLKEAYPDAEILLCTPTYTTYFEEGTQSEGTQGSDEEEYVEVVLELGKIWNIPVLDGYHTFGIYEENQAEYLDDGCHFNEKGRFFYAERIVARMRDF